MLLERCCSTSFCITLLTNVIECAEQLGLNTLIGCLGKGGRPGQYTGGPIWHSHHLAPTDAAFAELPERLVNYLKKHPAVLKEVLLGHAHLVRRYLQLI